MGAKSRPAKASNEISDSQQDAQQDAPQPEVWKRGRRPGVRRMIAAAAFMPMAARAPLYARLMWSLVQDPRTPNSRKVLLAGALAYVAIGRDIVPDGIPILGQLDDLVMVALATELFLDGLDDVMLAEKLQEAGIPRAAYDEDVARVRRLVPGPFRRAVRRIPGAIRFTADAVAQSGIPSRLREWLVRETPAALPARGGSSIS